MPKVGPKAGKQARRGAATEELRELAEPAGWAEALITQGIRAHIQITQQLLAQAAVYAEVAERIVAAYRNGKKVLLCGNGGSASDAQHIAAEFVGKFAFDRPALPAEALTVNMASLTAIANDFAFERIFARQVEAFGAAGDVCIGISTSGNSRNVIEAMRAARRMGITTVALTGASGGQLKAVADYCICVPSTETPRIQEHHILIGHLLCSLVEQALFGDTRAADTRAAACASGRADRSEADVSEGRHEQ